MPPLSRSLVISALACALVLAAWLAWPTEEARPADPTTSVDATDRADPTTTSAPLDTVDAAERRATVPTGADGATDEGPIVVTVVGPDGTPRAAAEVVFHTETSDEQPLTMRDRETIAWESEPRATDDRGEVRWQPQAGLDYAVFARHGSDWGQLYISRTSAERRHRLELSHDMTLRARVVDVGNQPVAGVAVQFTDEPYAAQSNGPGPIVETAEDGIAVFEHAHISIRDGWGDGAILRIACPLDEGSFAPIDLRNPPNEPVELRLPATGSIRFTLVDESGARVRGLLETVYGSCTQLTDTGEVSHWWKFDDGLLEVDPVGLGLRFRMDIDSAVAGGSVECLGPTQPGERVEVDVPIELRPTISGRLIDREGRPQQGYWHGTLMHGGRGWYNQYFETGEDGTFHTGVPELDYEVVGTRMLWIHRTLQDEAHHAFLDLQSLSLHPGRNELGDVVVEPPPVLVTGQVVREDGDGVPNAELAIARGDPEGELWYLPTAGDQHGTTDENGEFTIRASYVGDRLLLQAVDGGHRGPFVAFTPGSHVRYVLPRVGAIEIPVVFEGGLRPDDVLHELTDRGTGLFKRRAAHYVLEDGLVRWSAVPAGEYDLGARLVGAPEPLFVRRGIRVRGGETTRLDPVTLGDAVETLRVRVVDGSGQPVDNASIVVAPDHEPGTPRAAQQTVLGELGLHTTTVPVEVLVVAPGFRSVRRLVAKDATIRMEPGLEVELRLSLPDGGLADGQGLVPEIRRFDPLDPDPQPWRTGHSTWLRGVGKTFYSNRHPWLWRQKRRFTGSGSVTLRLPGPGSYAVDWTVDGPESRELGAAARRTFRVTDSAERQVVGLTLGADDLR